jgi:hypothetical protein
MPDLWLFAGHVEMGILGIPGDYASHKHKTGYIEQIQEGEKEE